MFAGLCDAQKGDGWFVVVSATRSPWKSFIFKDFHAGVITKRSKCAMLASQSARHTDRARSTHPVGRHFHG
jgi:hypothetical protein